jgi:predicted AAA+ superfamily ATPase
MIKRKSIPMLLRLAQQFPAVLILGPRQCGKTTLVKSLQIGRYFDLELSSDRQVFESDPELALRRINGPLLLDEAQLVPDLFPVLRGLIDERRHESGRFYLLGSVTPELVQGISESLAGRVGILELTPFILPEVMTKTDVALDALWLRGGYPDAFLASDNMAWLLMFENYFRTFIERDVPRTGLAFSPQQMRRFMSMLAHLHGGLLNASDLGRSMGISYHTVQKALDILEGHFLTRCLQPYHVNMGKRLVKSPKIYLRDSGLLHYLLGIDSEEGLFCSPARGRSWEGFIIEQLISRESLIQPGSQCYFYRTHTGVEIDLIIERGQKRIGYECKCATSVSGGDARGLRKGLEDGVIHEAYIVYQGQHRFPITENIYALPAKEALAEPATTRK